MSADATITGSLASPVPAAVGPARSLPPLVWLACGLAVGVAFGALWF